MSTAELPSVERILARHAGAARDALIPILQEVQREEGFISRDAVVRIGRHLKLPASKIYGVATFYNQFKFVAPGRYHVQVCRGTACHVKGSLGVQKALSRELAIDPGQTTKDGLFSLEVVACIGACGLAPVIAVNGRFHAGVTTDRVKRIVNSYRREAASHAAADE
jgi:NADH:ubiquinone oxidoreductase subunit E